MEALIHSINKIQDQFRVLKEDPIELPRIVVVGDQSAGKSSVLESMVQRSFLPRGDGMVTRCPLILQLIHCPEGDERRKVESVRVGQKRDHSGEPKVVNGAGDEEPMSGTCDVREWDEWAEFADSDQRFHLDAVHAEIVRRTDELVEGRMNIGSKPITLRVFSPRVTTLTLVDLPGIVKVPTPGQAEDIEKQILDVIHKAVEKKLSIILAVVPANVDLPTNECLKIAKGIDKEGERTLVVITKLDTIDNGKNAVDMLTGKVIPFKLGIIGVINRSQADIHRKKSIADTLKDEEKFLQAKYPNLAHQHGTPYLAKTLNEVLIQHIRKHLPSIKSRLAGRIKLCEKELAECGECVIDEKSTLLHIISDFTKSFSSTLEAESPDIKSPKLLGGPKISHIFKRMKTEFLQTQPCNAYCLEEVTVAIRNTDGTRPHFMVSLPAFEALMRPLITNLLQPALDCVSSVAAELWNVSRASIPRDASVRFPFIKTEILAVVAKMVEQGAKETEAPVKEAVLVEEHHITYSHFDSFKTTRIQEILSKPTYTYPVRFPSNPNYIKEAVERTGESADSIEKLLKRIDDDDKHIRMQGEMLDLYYKVVAEKIQDTVVKTIMTHLVNYVKENVHEELSNHMLGISNKLFKEDQAVTTKRIEKQKELKALKNSVVELNSLVTEH